LYVYGAYIATDPTDPRISVRHAASPHDAEASLRAELSTQIAGAQSDIEKRLTELSEAVAHGGDGTALAQAKAQLRALSRLQRRVADASAGSLTSIRNEVAATVAATQALVQQSSPSPTPSFQSAQVALQQASEAARSTTKQFMHDFYDRHIFDHYLKFASTEDEDEYRRREEERKHAIEKALAEHTPEGNLRANKLAIEQLKDAGAHGADRSPDYQPTLKGLEDNASELDAQIMTAKGVSSEKQQHSQSASQDDALNAAVTPDVIARLRAARVVIADQTGEGHGVTASDPQQSGARSPK
jgi:hypothetical protein